MARYPKPKAGELVIPDMKGYRLACCDCGLVHRLDFEVFEIVGRTPSGTFTVHDIPDGKVQIGFRAYRDERATGQKRRHRKP